ncbi:MAG: tyrosine-type recombinase/integrase [Gemmatimonadota bacterium]|nr:tyrosine-type recombinase/integrase [Gemmatimonadota bacterium]MDE2864702.1 tyrosine-type recombinase/integrase [Gemmatimonadota bacterium]
MPKRFTDAFVRTVKHSGRLSRNGKPRADTYSDEHGLILRVQPGGSKQWIWRGTVYGRRVDLGLGGYPYTSLAEARSKAFEHKKLARDGGDPRTARGRGVPTFAELAEKVIALHAKSWKGHVSERQWRNSLATYAYPHIGRMPVDKITTRDVLRVLEADDFWNRKSETARRIRQRIGAVMKYAMAKGYRQDNPAGGAVGVALPRNGNRKRHCRSLPHAEVTGALEKVRNSGAWTGTKLAIEFMVLTATRPGETRLALWEEIDFDTATWTIPEARAKTRKPHRVPLSPRALHVLTEALEIRDRTGLVFPSVTGRAMANVTMTKLLRELDIAAVSHGFRSSFRVWCGDTGVDRELAERALAHTVRNPVEAAYARGTMFERRRRLMADWAEYLAGGS